MKSKTNIIYQLYVESKTWHRLSYAWNRSRLTDTENRLVVAKRVRECEGVDWEFEITVKSLQSCPTLWDPRDGSPPGSPVPWILQARTLEWVAISSSNAGKWKVKVKSLSRVRPSATPWTAAFQAPPSMGFFRQEYWSGLPLPSLSLRLRDANYYIQNGWITISYWIA